MNFTSSVAVSAVCEHCRSLVVVKNSGVETMGVVAQLPPDLSPFQIGTTGEWMGSGFQITGRVRVGWEEGSWNEWCITYDATKTGWLAEAQGLLMISFPAEAPADLPKKASGYTANAEFEIANDIWTVDGVKQTHTLAAEGGLPFVAVPNEKRISVDLTNGKGGFANVELSGDGPDLFLGQYVEFDALKLANLKPVPGWNGEVAEERNRTTALTCPACGAAVNLRAAGQSMSAVCGSCGAIIDTATPSLEIVQKAATALSEIAPLLPIGQRGKIQDVEYEVIGLVKRRDQYSTWSEYLLFNPWQGFRWLVTFEGHWTFVTRLPAMPNVTANTFTKGGRHYRLFAKGGAEVTDVIGEFYWKVTRGESAGCFDYVSPPYILSKEEYAGLDEFTWSQGVYLPKKQVEQAFGVKGLQNPEGIYLNQPNPYRQRWNGLKVPFAIAAILLVVIEIFFMKQRPAVEVVTANFTYDRALKVAAATPPAGLNLPATAAPTPTPDPAAAPPQNVMVTPHFQLTGGQQKITIVGNAGVDNNWLDLDFDLVDAKTNQSYPAEMEISYYHGVEDGDAWTEGSHTATASIAGVPPGEYFLSVDADGEPAIATMPFTVTVQWGGLFASNFFLSLLFIAIYPIYVFTRGIFFERARWSESDFG